MNENGISPISGLAMRGHQNPQGDFSIYEEPMPGGVYTMWGSNIPFNADPNDNNSGRPMVMTRPCRVANLHLNITERDKLRAYAIGLVVKGHLEAVRDVPGRAIGFCLFVTKDEYDALEKGDRTPPSNYASILLDDLWRDAQRLTLTQIADQTLINLSLLEEVPSSELRIAIRVDPPQELTAPDSNQTAADRAEVPVGLVFGAPYGERPTVLALLHEQGFIALGKEFKYIGGGMTQIDGPKTIRITPKGYLHIEELLKGRGRREAFLICRFKEPLETLYRDVYRLVGNDEEVNCPVIRVKDEEHNDQIDDRILYKINHATVIVVDLSGGDGEAACTNFNVALEAGYALSLGKQIIWTLDKAKWPANYKLPFDIQNQNVLVYERGKLDEFRERLKFRMLAALDKSGGRSWS